MIGTSFHGIGQTTGQGKNWESSNVEPISIGMIHTEGDIHTFGHDDEQLIQSLRELEVTIIQKFPTNIIMSINTHIPSFVFPIICQFNETDLEPIITLPLFCGRMGGGG